MGLYTALNVCPHVNYCSDNGMGDAREILCDGLIIKRVFFLEVWIFFLKLIYLIDSYHLLPNLCSFLATWRIGQRCRSIRSEPVLAQQGGKS